MNAQLATRMDGVEEAFGLRDRAAIDLLGRLPPIAPRRIANLRGGVAAEILLARQFPDARIVSLEWEPLRSDAIEKDVCRSHRAAFCASAARVPRRPSLIFLQRSIGHAVILPTSSRTCWRWLNAGADWFAFQIPCNLHEPNRQLQRMVAVDGPWAERLLPIAKTRPFNETVEGLNAILGPVCARVEFWRQPMSTGWIASRTSLNRCGRRRSRALSQSTPLDEELRRQFLKRFAEKLRSSLSNPTRWQSVAEVSADLSPRATLTVGTPVRQPQASLAIHRLSRRNGLDCIPRLDIEVKDRSRRRPQSS